MDSRLLTSGMTVISVCVFSVTSVVNIIMESLRISKIIKFCDGVLLQGNPATTISSLSLDSRKLKKNDLFIAIKGERYDGHNFLKEVLKKGAKGAIINSGLRIKNSGLRVLIQVKNSRKALGNLAKGYRKRFKIPLIAITGSDGKTTTKELSALLLSSHFHLVKNPGNFNNEIGLPLTIFRLSRRDNLAIVELGMNRPGEIRRLAEIAKPTIGVITNIGEAHQGFFKNKYGIARAKAELIESLGKSPVILNRDSDHFSFLKKKAKGKVITFGIKKKSDFQAKDVVASSSGIEFRVHNLKIRSCLLGCFNVYNALIAIALAREFGISNQKIKKALQNFKPLAHHFQLINLRKFQLIDDTYNSNPFAFRKAIEELARMKTKGRRVVIAGEMKELGKFSKEAHYLIGKFIARRQQIDFLVTVGKLAKEIGKGALQNGFRKANILHCESNEEVVQSKNIFLPRDLILVKGSRATHLEEIVERMKEQA